MHIIPLPRHNLSDLSYPSIGPLRSGEGGAKSESITDTRRHCRRYAPLAHQMRSRSPQLPPPQHEGAHAAAAPRGPLAPAQTNHHCHEQQQQLQGSAALQTPHRQQSAAAYRCLRCRCCLAVAGAGASCPQGCRREALLLPPLPLGERP